MAMRHPTEECIEWNESALAASRESENIEFEKNNLLSLGIQLHSLGHYDKAIEYLEDAQALSSKLCHVKDFQVKIHDELGYLCTTTKKYQTSITYLKEAKTLAHQANLKIK